MKFHYKVKPLTTTTTTTNYCPVIHTTVLSVDLCPRGSFSRCFIHTDFFYMQNLFPGVFKETALIRAKLSDWCCNLHSLIHCCRSTATFLFLSYFDYKPIFIQPLDAAMVTALGESVSHRYCGTHS